MFKINDYVSRISYNHDIIFQIIDIKGDVAILEGFQERLVANAPFTDLILVDEVRLKDNERSSINRISGIKKLSRHKVHMTGKILHIISNTFLSIFHQNQYEEFFLSYGLYVSIVS